MFASGKSASVSTAANYIEDVFSTWLYTGTGATQTITNGIDLSTKGGLVWIKSRGQAANHRINDTSASVAGFKLATNSTAALAVEASGLTSFNSNGFSIGSDGTINTTNDPLVSWTFRKQAKFFDIVTYTGNGSNRTIAHNLGSVPGCMLVKRTDTAESWIVYHRSLTDNFYYLVLNSTAAEATDMAVWNGTTPTSSVFSVGTNVNVNASGGTYVAYLFAHNAGGFGLTGSDNVISCGSYSGTGAAGNAITLGYEPQWVMIKRTDTANYWHMQDTMRGSPVAGASQVLYANDSGAEFGTGSNPEAYPTATGFTLQQNTTSVNASGGTYIYIAIRRGPMKVPTDATKVFAPIARTGTSANATVTAGFAPDLVFPKERTTGVGTWFDKLRGITQYFYPTSSASENSTAAYGDVITAFTNTGMTVGADTTFTYVNNSGEPMINYFFQRAPSFFDEVCYTGTGSATTVTHNLAAVPELMISKRRDAGPSGWAVYSATLGATKYMRLQTNDAFSTGTTVWNDTAPTSTQFTLGSTQSASGGTYVAYLFATCAGVSKVGSYTGTAALLTVNCGFTSGARFVLIKRTDSTGDWYVYDSARGISSGTDPYLLLNDTAAETTGTNYVDTDTTGFKVTAAAPAGLNASGGTYIFLAIA